MLYGIAAYGLWGIFPLYLLALTPAGWIEIAAVRLVFSLIACILIITVMGLWGSLAAVFRSRNALGALTLAAFLSAANVLTYIFSILTGSAMEAALGAFISPLLTALLGVFVLRERLRPLQWIAIGIGSIALLVLVWGFGKMPWIALVLALTWGFYGLTKNKLGETVDAITSYTVESAVLAPIAIAVTGWLYVTGALTLTRFGPWHFALLAMSGVFTAAVMIFFGASARRLPMTTMGLLQYVSPCMVFVFAATVLGEHLSPEKWAGFTIVWLALVILSVDLLLSRSRTTGAGLSAKS